MMSIPAPCFPIVPAAFSPGLLLMAAPVLIAGIVVFTLLHVFAGRRKARLRHGCGQSGRDEDKLLRDILTVMEEEQIYLRKGLTLEDLAQRLACNRSYVSGCINDNLGLSFSDFVNLYRVRYAQALLRLDKDCMPMNEVRDRSGFEADSTFTRNFRKVAGCSPSEWRMSQTCGNDSRKQSLFTD